VVDGDRELPGRRLSQTPPRIGVGLCGQRGLLLARGAHPSGEPLRRQVGVGGAELPGAGPDDDLGPHAVKRLHGRRDGVRSEEAAALRRAALVIVEGVGHGVVQRIRGRECNATDDRQRQQDRTAGAGAETDQPGQVLLGQQVKQRRSGDDGGAGEIARAQPGDVRAPGLDGDRGPVGGRAGEIGGGDRQQLGVAVVHDPVLGSAQPGRQPAAHRAGPAAEVVNHPAAGCREPTLKALDEVAGPGGGVRGLAQGQPFPADPNHLRSHRDALSRTAAITDAVVDHSGSVSRRSRAARRSRARSWPSPSHARSAAPSAAGSSGATNSPGRIPSAP
jgi:hypothetical protein